MVVNSINLKPLPLGGALQIIAFACDFQYGTLGPVSNTYVLAFISLF